MNLPITPDNVHEWFPSPHAENPLAGEDWWQLQMLGLFMAIQMLRLIPNGDYQQQALIELRRGLDTGLLAVKRPSDEEITRRMAQTLAPWCPSPFSVVDAMLELGAVTTGDHVVDLGSGDGRIVFAACKRGALATGVDIDARFVAESRERIKEDPAYSNAWFEQADIRSRDIDSLLSSATVVTCYLLTSSMASLREKFQHLRPGTRIISHAFPIDGWTPTASTTVDGTPIFLWIVPPVV